MTCDSTPWLDRPSRQRNPQPPKQQPTARPLRRLAMTPTMTPTMALVMAPVMTPTRPASQPRRTRTPKTLSQTTQLPPTVCTWRVSCFPLQQCSPPHTHTPSFPIDSKESRKRSASDDAEAPVGHLSCQFSCHTNNLALTPPGSFCPVQEHTANTAIDISCRCGRILS